MDLTEPEPAGTDLTEADLTETGLTQTGGYRQLLEHISETYTAGRVRAVQAVNAQRRTRIEPILGGEARDD